MTDKKTKSDIQKGFGDKSSQSASPRTEEERKRSGKEAVKKFRAIRERIYENGLSEDEAEKLLEEYMEEECGEGADD